jgi:hypothetical protein
VTCRAVNKASSVFTRLLIVVAITIAGIAGTIVASPAAHAASCGDVLTTVNGVDVKSNGVYEASSTGNSCGGSTQNTALTPGGVTVSTGSEWQCVEFVNRYYAQNGWISSHWFGNGSTLKDNLPSGLTFMPNGAINSIVVGDVVTLNYSTFGHAGVVSAVSGSTITIANQNAGAGLWGTATYDPSAKTLSSEYSGGFSTQGIIHAAANTGTVSGGTGSSSSSIRVAGDFNGDGKSDTLNITPRGTSGINIVPLLSDGSGSFNYGGLWYWDVSLTIGQFKLVPGDFNGDGKTDLALITSHGTSGINVTVLLSNGSTGFTYNGLWYYDTSTTFSTFRNYPGDFNGDGKTDLAIVTPQGTNGINVTTLLSNGSTGFTYNGLWYSDTGLTIGNFQFLVGDYNNDGYDDLATITSRGTRGINVVPLLSNGSSSFAYSGLWYYDTSTVYTSLQILEGDFNGDNKSDLLLVTPRGTNGINVVPLLSNGSSSFAYSGLWYYDTSLTIGQFQFLVGDYDGVHGDDLNTITPHGTTGINMVPLLSNSSSSFAYSGLWYYDTTSIF